MKTLTYYISLQKESESRSILSILQLNLKGPEEGVTNDKTVEKGPRDEKVCQWTKMKVLIFENLDELREKVD